MSWQLGPEHPAYGLPLTPRPSRRSATPRARSTYAKPHGYRCSQCGAEKPAARTLCPCGAFRRPTPPTGEAGAVRTPAPSVAAPAASGHRTIRVISTWVQSPRCWRSDAARFARGYRDGSRPDRHGGEARRVRQAAATAALWGLPVGVITGVREETA